MGLALALLVIGLWAGACTSSDGTSGRPKALPEQGRLVWELEGLMRHELPKGEVYAVHGVDFRCTGSACVRLPGHDRYDFVFPAHRTSTFILASGHFEDAGPGEALVRIRGRAIVCAKGRLLVRYSDGDTSSFGCLGDIAFVPRSTRPRTSPTTTPNRTTILHIDPIGRDGHLAPGYSVTSTSEGDCHAGSDAGGPYRCFAGDYVMDPCWADTARSVVCPDGPWSTGVSRITVDHDLEAPDPGRHGIWGVDVGGETCQLLEGTRDVIDPDADPATVMTYSCTPALSGGPDDLVLVAGPDGDIDDSGEVWTAHAARITPDGYELIPEPLTITTARVISSR